MSKLIKNYPGEFPDLDHYGVAELTKKTAAFISRKLTEDNTCSFAMNMGDSTMFNVTFVNIAPTIHTKEWAGGRGKLYIAFERIGCFSFLHHKDLSPSYFEEKMGRSFGGTISERFCKFLKDIII